MSRARVSATSLLLFGLGLAGCLEEEKPLDLPVVPVPEHEHPETGWSVSGTDCLEGGFVAAYNMEGPFFAQGRYWVQPWERADIRAEIGNPKLTSLAFPLTGPATGHWHQGIRCKTMTHNGTTLENFQFGYVGGATKPPPFDPGGADFHMLLAGFGFQDLEPRKDLVSKTAADITRSKESRVDWYGPAAVYAVYDDFEKGTYLSYSPVIKYRDVPERTWRFWWVVPADGSRSHHDHHAETDGSTRSAAGYNPVYWDLRTGGGAQHVTPDSVNVGCHTGTDAHGPQGGACQHTITVLYEHKTVELTYGGVLRDVVLAGEWVH